MSVRDDCRCATCFFFLRKYAGTEQGECRIDPPRMGGTGYGAWPWVTETDWCGQHSYVVEEEPQT